MVEGPSPTFRRRRAHRWSADVTLLLFAEFHSKSEEKNVTEEFAVLLRRDLRDRLPHSKGGSESG